MLITLTPSKPSRFKSILFLLSVLFLVTESFAQAPKINVLVFSKTEAFRHNSIGAGKTALAKMAKEKGFAVNFTEDSKLFNEKELRKYNAVIFLNTTGDVLNDGQQASFERYIQAGGGYLGIHSATDCEYEWPWYGQLAGAYFLDHPSTPSNVQKGKYSVKEKGHWATQGMPDEFERMDEFYSFRDISPKINVVLTIDEKSYQGGKNPDFHPMSWYQEFDGGRSFYTAMGHTDETFSEPLFLNHLWAGINYVAGGPTPKPLDYTKSRPEENRFTKVILEEKLDEPMELTLLNDGRVLFIQRKGEVRIYNTKTKQLKTIAKIPVSLKYVSKEGKESVAEDGLLGLNKDPNFAQNHWIYLYYSVPDVSKNVLARFELRGEELIMDSKKVMLEIPTQREECCHTGGSIAWDKTGNLYLSTGDNTNPHGSDGFSPSDEREGRSAWDAQKSSANTNDLRGKIIRIKPTADGGYTIPEGNLFPKGTADTRPEIYTMGHRNPFRISIDQKTGYLYWGEVGPDGSKPADDRGPAGHDEVGQAKAAGNYGWPHFVGDNKAYNRYDFANKKSLEKWEVNAPVNTSPNNTGLKKLPPAQKAFIWYPYAVSKEFPLVGSGGRNAMAGPVYYSEDFKNASNAFSKYYDGKLLAYEWMRGWIMAVTMDKDGNYKSMERFMPSYKFSNPMDMEFAENGDLYMLEYGSGWFSANDDARLIRIEYNAGNRKPQIQLAANQMGGAIPFNLKLTAKGTTDADGDDLKYAWKITSKNGFTKLVSQQDAALTLTKPGIYKAVLTVNDGKGGVSSQAMEITAGNEPPVLTFEMPKSNQTFFVADKTVGYEVKVKDKEDGSLADGRISSDQVSVKIDYLPEGFDKVAIAQGHRSADELSAFAKGKNLIAASDCKACHSAEKKSIGPAYREIGLKYQNDNSALEKLTKKVITGGSGVWGETAMAGHPQLSTADASEMVKYILNIAKAKPAEKSLPVQGAFTAKLPAKDKGQGVYILRAAYQDQGANGLPSISAEQTHTLRNSKLGPHDFDKYEDVSKMTFGGNAFAIPSKDGSYMLLKNIDLAYVEALNVTAMAPIAQLNSAGGKVEVRVDAPNGKLIGESEAIEPSNSMAGKPVSIKITPTTGSHDLYLVYRNPKADGRSLFIVTGCEVKLIENETKQASVITEKPAESIADYIGKYKVTGLPFDFIEIKNADGKLTMVASGQAGELKPTETADKYDADGKALITFIRGDNGNVGGLKMDAMGMTFEGKRE
ncbi:ThuA domain-containing protein [Dyadobacter diqingensis]|uniref:ThuA domain-containing protein n=1 Tax=Dyadobacter diqingensis TaxID=2938121 RepID=UPI0020C1948B|nr:ThuA domain-containing protein [Dyadobacter diqingensis]